MCNNSCCLYYNKAQADLAIGPCVKLREATSRTRAHLLSDDQLARARLRLAASSRPDRQARRDLRCASQLPKLLDGSAPLVNAERLDRCNCFALTMRKGVQAVASHQQPTTAVILFARRASEEKAA